jgi:WD40 repeat protein
MSPLRVLCTLLLAPAAWAGPPADLYGDPLPPGAVQRFGTVRHRVVGESFRFSADSRSIKVIGWGRYVSVLDARTGLVTAAHALPIDDARSGHLLPDGVRAIIVRQPRWEDGQGVWELWDVDRRVLVRRLGAADFTVPAGLTPNICPAGRTAVFIHYDYNTADRSQSIVLTGIDLDTGTTAELFRLKPPPQMYPLVLGPVFTPDGRHLVCGMCVNNTCELRCWDAGAKKEAWTKTVTGTDPQPSLASLPDGRFLLFDQSEGRAFEARTGDARPVRLPEVVRASFRFTFNRNGFFLPGGVVAFVRQTGTNQKDVQFRLQVWEWEKDRSRAGADGWDLGRFARPVAVAPDGKSILLSSDPYQYATGDIRLIDLTTGRPVWADTREAGHTRAVDYLTFSADGRRLASTGDDGDVRAWDVATGRPLGTWPGARAAQYMEQTSNNGRMSWITSAGMAWAADGGRLVFPTAGPEPPRLRLIDVDTGRSRVSPPFPGTNLAYCGPPVLGPDADTVSLTCGGGGQIGPASVPTHTLARYSVADDRWTVVGPIIPTPVLRGAVGRAGTFWARGAKYRAADGQPAVTLAGAAPGPFAPTPDDRLVAGTSGPDFDWQVGPFAQPPSRDPIVRTLVVWDAGSGEVVSTFPWGPAGDPAAPRRADLTDLHWGWPRHLALHPTGRWLATSDVLGVRLWDVMTKQVVHRFEVPLRPSLHVEFGSPATALAFTPGGSKLATGHPDGTILLWDVPLSRPAAVPPADADRLWAELMGDDPAAGWRAAWRLANDPAAAVRLARAGLVAARAVPADDLRKLLTDVEAPRYAVRERATQRLETLADLVRPAVADALKATTSEETRVRLTRVLAAAPGLDRPLSARAAAQGRAVAVVERAGGDEARRLLEEWAKGAPDAWLTREAVAALDRLRGR